MKHMSAKNLAYLVEDALQISKYKVVRPNVGLVEQAESTQMAGNLEQGVMKASGCPVLRCHPSNTSHLKGNDKKEFATRIIENKPILDRIICCVRM